MNTLERLQALIHQKFDIAVAAMDPDAPFASYDIDSLTLAELMFAIDDELHVVVPDEAIHTVATLRGIAELIDALPPVAAAA